MIKKLLTPLMSCLLLALPPYFWILSAEQSSQNDPKRVLTQYLKYLYARDFRQAYRYISSEDQRLKSSADYVRERQAFSGLALDAARKLAGLIEIRSLTAEPEKNRSRVTAEVKLPDANSVASLLLDWDEKRLDALSASERKQILSTLDGLISANKLPMIDGEENFVLVKESSKWKIFLDWAAGAQVQFSAQLPPGNEIIAEPMIKSTIARSGDLFTVGFKVKNDTTHEIVTRIAHRVEPKELGPYLDLVDCALLLPVRIRPGEEQVYNSTYVVRGDLPDGAKTIRVTYDFQEENR